VIRCKKCDVLVNTLSENCPLCGSKIPHNDDNIYPITKRIITSNFLRKILIFNVLCISMIVLLINYTITPDVNWCGFVIAGLISFFIIFDGIMMGRKKVLKLMFYMCIVLILITLFWDYYTGFRGWSINYAFPSLLICYGLFLLVLRFVSYFAFRANSNIIYLHVLLEFVPFVLLQNGIITFKPLSIICACLGILNLLILLLFDYSRLKLDLEKKLHI